VMHHRKADWAAAAELANCLNLSASWKDSLWLRAENKQFEHSSLLKRQA